VLQLTLASTQLAQYVDKYRPRMSAKNVAQLGLLARIMEAWTNRMAWPATPSLLDGTPDIHGLPSCRRLVEEDSGDSWKRSCGSNCRPCAEELVNLAEFSFTLKPSLDTINLFAVSDHIEEMHLAQRVRAARCQI